MGGVGAGEALSWDDAGNDKSSENAIAAEWIVSLRILNLFPTGRTLRPFLSQAFDFFARLRVLRR